jgi:hypothetical protein
MDGQEQARLWKDPDARDAAGDDHPAGALNLGSRVLVGLRSAALAGMAAGIGVLSLEGGTTTHPTVSAIGGG